MDLLAERRVRRLCSYFARHSQTRYSICSPRYIKALSVQLGAQVLIVILAVRPLTSLWKGYLPAVETRRHSSFTGSCARTSFVAQVRGTTDSMQTRPPLHSSATNIQGSASLSKGPPTFSQNIHSDGVMARIAKKLKLKFTTTCSNQDSTITRRTDGHTRDVSVPTLYRYGHWFCEASMEGRMESWEGSSSEIGGFGIIPQR